MNLVLLPSAGAATDAPPRLDPRRAALVREQQVRLGLWMFLATVAMLFAAFASAYLVRRSGSDWHPLALPRLVWANTLVLAASSWALEAAHRAGRARRWTGARAAMVAAVALGLGFLAGQLAAWRLMTVRGASLAASPQSSFFYVLTGAHALHLVAALAVLARTAAATGPARRDPRGWSVQMSVCRTFWHFLGGVWLFVLALLLLS